jgi:heme exporter protein A
LQSKKKAKKTANNLSVSPVSEQKNHSHLNIVADRFHAESVIDPLHRHPAIYTILVMEIPTGASLDTPAIETRSLNKNFGNFKVLRGIDLSINRGATLAVFGPNGAGKTTLIKTLATVIRPSSGQIFINGQDVAEHALEARAGLGLLAHQSFLYGALTAEENLHFYCSMYGVTPAAGRVREVLELIGLSSRRFDRVSTFSRGMQQRLALGRALLHKPPVLLLDEPDTGLDPQGLSAMWRIIKAEVPGGTVLFTSHNFERALTVCDKVAIISGGRLAFQEQSCKLTLESLQEAYRNCTGGEK